MAAPKRIQFTTDFLIDGVTYFGAWDWRADCAYAVTLTIDNTARGPVSVTFARCLLAAGMVGAAGLDGSAVQITPIGEQSQLLICLSGGGRSVQLLTNGRRADRFLRKTLEVIPACADPASCADPWCMECRTVAGAAFGDTSQPLDGAR